MLKSIDNSLNNLTMYRLVAYGLSGLAVLSLLLSLLGTLSLPIGGMLLSLGLLLVGCFGVNWLMAHVWQVAANSESWYITALVLFFILPQATDTKRAGFIFLAGAIAMVSKYVLAWNGKHIFNPAALAATTLSLSGLMGTTWWIGSSLLWPITLIVGLVVARKLRRFPLYLSFIAVSLLTTIVASLLRDIDVMVALKSIVTASPLLFLGGVMLTEPSTMPPIRRQQVIFASLVAILYASQISVAGNFIYPELALLVGNLFAFAISPKYRLRLRLKEVQQLSDRISNYVFEPDRKLDFKAGQYIEWTLPIGQSIKTDDRGNRRTFTIASSPTEDTIQLGVKFYRPSSAFKQTLQTMKPGQYLYAGQLAGNFTLPHDATKKLVFVAGGIGITPFRSMLKYLIDTDDKRDVTLLYLVNGPEEIVYKDILAQATKHGTTIIPVVANGKTDIFNQTLLEDKLGDYQNRTFYLSGPKPMVDHCKHTLLSLNIPRTHIETDYFSGY